MKLIIGGYAQGKLKYVLEQYGLKDCRVWDGELPKEEENGKTAVMNHFHNWVKSRLLSGGRPEEEIRVFLEKHPDCVIICDEIGNGIVPVEAFERQYRERTGRILIELAKKAEEVVRVICGIGQKIK
ncbi:MAG: bifunctional adenosylcobinamide kinase/adenosylcobinamide-phosphate guanylyltransferase [Clostridium sp.]|nr:bifunctional adenosylcobinamide kinase/adenosylcobinamide-phosphate guanylyltransferase [Clostridium sp.]